MKLFPCRPMVTIFALVIFALPPALATVVRAGTPTIDPAATESLKQMSDYLGGLKQFKVKTQNTVEDMLVSGHRIDIDVSAEVTISRPNRILSERRGDMVDQVFYYNGNTLTLYNPGQNVYATRSVPDSFEGLFKYMYEKLSFGIPVSDLVYSDSYPLLMEGVKLAAVLEKTYIDGIRCDHLLFSRPGVDFQIWISEGDRPLPLKYIVTDTTTPELLSVSTFMTDWNVQPEVKDDLFIFTPPKGTQAIDFMPF